MSKRWMGVLVLAGATGAHLGCADKSPLSPTAGLVADAGVSGNGAGVRAANAPPKLVVRTRPEADYTTNPPTITVVSKPARVFFGLCQSEDPDPGDSLNWQFHFGDSSRPAFNPDGTFNPDHEHECRAEHEYEYKEGTYTATVSVTDKHLEDQGRDVRSLARKSQQFTIRVTPIGDDCPLGRGASVATDFDAFAPFDDPDTLTVPGVSFNGSGAFIVIPLFFVASGPVPPLSGNIVFGGGAPFEMTFQSDQESYRFDAVADDSTATAFIVRGFDEVGTQVFTNTFSVPPAPSCGCDPVPFPVGGSGRFRRLVITAPPFDFFALDNLSTQAACLAGSTSRRK